MRHDMRIELNFFNWYSVVYLVLFYGLSLYWGNGRTIGKRLVGIQVVSLVPHDLGRWQAVERALGYGASALEGGFGLSEYFIHPNRRIVHDRIAGTIVIRDVPQTFGASTHAERSQQIVDSHRIQ